MSQIERIAQSDSRQIDLIPGAHEAYLLVIDESKSLDLVITTPHPDSTVRVHALMIAQPDHQCKLNIQVQLASDNCKADVHLISFLGEGGNGQIDGSVVINPQTTGCSGHLLEENIILGEHVRIKTLPMLDVRSSDVQASHGARIERLNPQHLFYLNAKGINSTDAQKLMVEGYINDLCHPFADHGEILNIKKQLLEKILATVS